MSVSFNLVLADVMAQLSVARVLAKTLEKIGAVRDVRVKVEEKRVVVSYSGKASPFISRS